MAEVVERQLLRERLGESLRTIQGDPPLEDVTTSSIGALRRYAQAVRVYDAGVDDETIRTMTVNNPRRFLAFVPRS